jgi:hypothetical protein
MLASGMEGFEHCDGGMLCMQRKDRFEGTRGLLSMELDAVLKMIINVIEIKYLQSKRKFARHCGQSLMKHSWLMASLVNKTQGRQGWSEMVEVFNGNERFK